MSWLDKATLCDQIDALTCNTSVILGHPVLQSVSKKVFRKVLRKNRCARKVSGNLDEVAGRVPNPERTHPCPVPGIQIWATGWANKKYSVICEVRFLLCFSSSWWILYLCEYVREFHHDCRRDASVVGWKWLQRRWWPQGNSKRTPTQPRVRINCWTDVHFIFFTFTSFLYTSLEVHIKGNSLCRHLNKIYICSTTNYCTHTYMYFSTLLYCSPFLVKSLQTYFTEPFASRPASSVAKVLSSERGVGGGLGPPPSSPPRPSVDRVSGGQMSSASGGSPAPAQPSPLSKKRQQHPTFEQWMVTNRDKAKVLVDQVHTYY